MEVKELEEGAVKITTRFKCDCGNECSFTLKENGESGDKHWAMYTAHGCTLRCYNFSKGTVPKGDEVFKELRPRCRECGQRLAAKHQVKSDNENDR